MLNSKAYQQRLVWGGNVNRWKGAWNKVIVVTLVLECFVGKYGNSTKKLYPYRLQVRIFERELNWAMLQKISIYRFG